MKRWIAPGALALAALILLGYPIVGTPREGKFVHRTEPNGNSAEFDLADNEPGTGKGWYSVRVTRVDRNTSMIEPDLGEVRVKELRVEAV
jgi:hypothetical protein